MRWGCAMEVGRPTALQRRQGALHIRLEGACERDQWFRSHEVIFGTLQTRCTYRTAENDARVHVAASAA